MSISIVVSLRTFLNRLHYAFMKIVGCPIVHWTLRLAFASLQHASVCASPRVGDSPWCVSCVRDYRFTVPRHPSFLGECLEGAYSGVEFVHGECLAGLGEALVTAKGQS